MSDQGDGSTDVEEIDRLVGSRYRLKQKVGQGAMGVVWQAYDEQLHRVVAAKELLALDGQDDAKIERAKARAMREARLAARLEHPNAIRVYDVVEDDGRPWLIMEYLPSRSLAVVITEQGTLPPREVARIGCYTAAALAAAHRHGIQHRDVKPGNVLIGDQEVKITDFGISRATDDGTATATGTVGTPAFFSPEVARGEEAGLPSDVFSLGATLYNAVEGAPPFGAADNHIAMLHRVASGSFMPPANAGPLLAPVLFRLLANEPERRPTMEEAVHLLADVVNGSPPVSEATLVLPRAAELPVEAQPDEAKKDAPEPDKAAGVAAAGLVAAAAQAEAAGLTAREETQAGQADPAAEESPAEAIPAEATPPATQASPEPTPAQTSATAAATTSQPATTPMPPSTQPAPTPILPAVVPAQAAHPTPPPAEAEENLRKFPLVPIAVVILVLAVGVGAFLLWPKGNNNPSNSANGNTASNTPSATQPNQTASDTPSQQPTQSQPQSEPPASPSNNPNPTTPPPASPQTAQQAVEAYYALIPGDLQTGYSLLTDRLKAARAPSFANYQSFWSRFTSVQVSDAVPQGDNVVSVTLRYMQGSSVFTTERHTYTLVQQNGKWMIDSQAGG